MTHKYKDQQLFEEEPEKNSKKKSHVWVWNLKMMWYDQAMMRTGER
ncbi:MAG: hypothetical protein GY795_31515 [Desulfobacterales bacterium]|nr:hypothetical protein [Desulfobacterales bacterium]